MSVDTSKMTPEEYAAFVGKKSYPAGQEKEKVYQKQVADYVSAFIRDLEDPDIRLVTEKPHDWKNYGAEGKAAILSALKQRANP